MEFITELKPFIDGSVSAFNFYLLFLLLNLKSEMQREKEYFIKFREQEKDINNNLEQRLTKLEIQAARRWSTWK